MNSQEKVIYKVSLQEGELELKVCGRCDREEAEKEEKTESCS
jgi:hypothetical protein